MDITVNGRTVNGRTVEVNTLDTKAIIELYNQLAFELDETPVNRFANRSKAESRLVAIADRHAAMVRNREAAAPLTALDTMEPVTLVQKRTPDGASVLVAPAHSDPVQVHQTITPSADGQSVTVDTQVTVQLDGADKAQIKAEAAARAPVPAGAPRWARPKQEEPGRIAYRPRRGTQQWAAYELLTQPGGVDMIHFCEVMTPLNGPGTKPWVPASTWSVLRYLFCTGKGYGLSFDGKNLKLIVPADEREAVKATSQKAA